MKWWFIFAQSFSDKTRLPFGWGHFYGEGGTLSRGWPKNRRTVTAPHRDAKIYSNVRKNRLNINTSWIPSTDNSFPPEWPSPTRRGALSHVSLGVSLGVLPGVSLGVSQVVSLGVSLGVSLSVSMGVPFPLDWSLSRVERKRPGAQFSLDVGDTFWRYKWRCGVMARKKRRFPQLSFFWFFFSYFF